MHRLNQRVGKETDLDDVGSTMMTEEEAEQLTEKLSNYLGNHRSAEIINDIRSVTEPFTLYDVTQTGNCTQAEADQWIAAYKEVIGVPKKPKLY